MIPKSLQTAKPRSATPFTPIFAVLSCYTEARRGLVSALLTAPVLWGAVFIWCPLLGVAMQICIA
ncbi:hypothetical protein SBA4_3530003 [Candidatus Sulfopaludibacter sp. SbA4]|nr:hypothetical protein SBA4_3530003 [Candidatus Sulfopaludibacter sp. SbA4]